MNLERCKTLMRRYIAADIPVFLWGAPGIGKSEAVAQLAAEFDDVAFIDERLNLYESVDLRGLPRDVDGNVIWSIPELFQRLNEASRTHRLVYLFLDEMNTAAQSVMTAAMQLVLNRRLGPHIVPKNVRIIGAGNRRGDRAAANAMQTALRSRFANMTGEADAPTWINWAKDNGIEPVLIGFHDFRQSYGGSLLHIMPKDGADDAAAFPTPRGWVFVDKVLKGNPPEDDLHPLTAGLVGKDAAGEFVAFYSTWRNVPKLADILADPDNHPVPGMDKPGLLYATGVMLANRATRANFAPIITYLDRMPADVATSAVIEATKRDKSLCATPAFVGWAARNSDVAV